MRILTDDEAKLLMKPRWTDWSREGCDAYDAIGNSHEALRKALAEALAFIETVADDFCPSELESGKACPEFMRCAVCRARLWRKERPR